MVKEILFFPNCGEHRREGMSIEAVLGMLGKIVSLLKDLNIFIWPRLELKLGLLHIEWVENSWRSHEIVPEQGLARL